MSDALPAAARRILVWHQGALGDVLLAGPALQAVAARYPGARFTLVGGPEQLGLLTLALPVAAVWSSQRALWLDLFQDGGPINPGLQALLYEFDLALVFSPREQPQQLQRWRQAGVGNVFWLPSFPVGERLPINRLQGERLRQAGLAGPLASFRLALPDPARQQARDWLAPRRLPERLLVALAPGSGHPKKNWPLASYAALANDLADRHGAQIWWVFGPAETGLESVWRQLSPKQGAPLPHNLSLGQLAAILTEFQLFVGNDSGVAHLAAAVGGPYVAAIFGPSDPLIWAPPGDRTKIITPEQPCAPCTPGREIACPEPVCLSSLGVEQVSAAVAGFFAPGGNY